MRAAPMFGRLGKTPMLQVLTSTLRLFAKR
ncbi:protein of unknown function [Paraburkholderia dioscoreae]|uniref:Uncharacterized protein n=1 Tax=Paraburkholderia dioscoreae TaxID=2604047 RepID=A0A5Q4ZCB4_9BURK|nr:protein of unknown function [Paraburkholderia dioscoreae]